MASLSVVLATFNEEENLAACLDSVKELADEIVIVDGRSTDRTVDIVKQYGGKVKITNNPPIFHINKQKAINMATKDWVLQLDADERVTRELTKEIKERITHNSSQVNGYWIPRKNWFLGRFLMKGGVYPDYTLRLYRRGKGRLPQKSVHEQAVIEGEAGYLKNPLIHMADTSFGRYLKRWSRYTSLICDELKAQKHSPLTAINFLIIKPIWWFLLTYIRHKGFMDSWQGFVFCFFSSIRFPSGYFKFILKK